MSIDNVPEKSLRELVVEHNAAADNFERAMAEVVNLFGASFEGDRVREIHPFCDLQSKEHRAYETLGNYRRVQARRDELSSIAAKIFSCEKCRGEISEIASRECACPDHAATFVTLFFRMEGKMYGEKHIIEIQGITTAPQEAAKQLGSSERYAIATTERQKYDKSKSKKETGKKASLKSKEKTRKLQAFAIKLYRKNVRAGKNWSDNQAANVLDVKICEYAREILGIQIKAKKDSRIKKYQGWFRGRKLQSKYRRSG